MNDDDPLDDDDRPPEVDTPLDVARREFIQGKWAAGWKYDGNWTIHPADDEIRFIVDPFTGEITFSAKYAATLDDDPAAVELIEQTRKQLEQEKRSGSP